MENLNMRNIVIGFHQKHHGNFEETYRAFTDKEKAVEPKGDLDNYICILDSDYPECLKEIEYPVFVINVKATAKVLDAMLGTRKSKMTDKEYLLSAVDSINPVLLNLMIHKINEETEK